jgi:translation initiation factor 2B subunit (eIF-2B alpha/beta/delta family)
MNEQQLHLQSAIQQQNELIQEIQELNTKIVEKREMAVKLQGIIEYLQQTGVTVPEPEVTEETAEAEVAAE